MADLALAPAPATAAAAVAFSPPAGATYTTAIMALSTALVELGAPALSTGNLTIYPAMNFTYIKVVNEATFVTTIFTWVWSIISLPWDIAEFIYNHHVSNPWASVARYLLLCSVLVILLGAATFWAAEEVYFARRTMWCVNRGNDLYALAMILVHNTLYANYLFLPISLYALYTHGDLVSPLIPIPSYFLARWACDLPHKGIFPLPLRNWRPADTRESMNRWELEQAEGWTLLDAWMEDLKLF